MIQKALILICLVLVMIPTRGVSQNEDHCAPAYEAPSIGFSGNKALREELENFLYGFAAERELSIKKEDNLPLFYKIFIYHQHYGYGWGVVDVANYIDPAQKGVLGLLILAQEDASEELLTQTMCQLKEGLEEKFNLSFQINQDFGNK